ncbi:MAG: DUF3048 domain-containing protein [Eubacterium sp.]|nr:DUF3048 domain-containing protein [Eubacterium sp.]
MRRRKSLLMCGLMAVLAISLFACGKQEEEEVQVEIESADPVESAEPVVVEETGDASYLTGEIFEDQSYANCRPVAVMIPNDNYGALPQYGISYAGVIYEVPVEAPYTRLMAIFDQAVFDEATTIGPVRSCRLYYCYFALEFDAIYAHYGQSEYAKSFLSSGEIDNLSGLEGAVSNIMYWRDTSRSEPDNVFTSGETILEAIEYKEYETEHDEDYEAHYNFADEEITPDAEDNAYKVAPGYDLSKPWFEYNEEDGLYYRYEYNSAQNDALTGEQLSFKNIIIQSCSYSMMSSHNTYDINTTGSGDGWYITNGNAQKITWSKDSTDEPAKYYDESGEEIEINTGKTWVSIVLNDDFDGVTLTSKADLEEDSE